MDDFIFITDIQGGIGVVKDLVWADILVGFFLFTLIVYIAFRFICTIFRFIGVILGIIFRTKEKKVYSYHPIGSTEEIKKSSPPIYTSNRSGCTGETREIEKLSTGKMSFLKDRNQYNFYRDWKICQDRFFYQHHNYYDVFALYVIMDTEPRYDKGKNMPTWRYKIGYTNNPAKRLADLQVGSSSKYGLKLIFVIYYHTNREKMECDIEKPFHNWLHENMENHVRGEWFQFQNKKDIPKILLDNINPDGKLFHSYKEWKYDEKKKLFTGNLGKMPPTVMPMSKIRKET